MIRRFLAALQFLTVLPIAGNTASPSQAAVFFPLTGALLGASAGAVLLSAGKFFGPALAAALAIAWLVTITGCIHEDGLADVADAFRAGRTRDRILSILRDSRIGTYGAVALIVSMLLRWQALAQCRINPIYGLAAALACSRTAMVVLAAVTPAAGEGLGREFVTGTGGLTAFITIAQAVAMGFLAGWPPAAAMLLTSGAVVLLARLYFLRRLGGVNGDCLGATCQIVETANLLVLTWRYSS